MLVRTSIAAIVPCYNEEATVGRVVGDLRQALPTAEIYVYDNNSTDRTAEVAAAAGAIVRTETRKGKGNVVRRALADIDAEIYLMIDGDDTYDALAAATLVRELTMGPYDLVTGIRSPEHCGAFRSGHELGNRFFNIVVSKIFGHPATDMLSGYRVFSRRFAKSFPAMSKTFEIETELTIHAINNRMPQADIEVGFRDRPSGSESKLRTYHDGLKILRMIGALFVHERPLTAYLSAALALLVSALLVGAPIIFTYLMTNAVPRLPTAVLASSLTVLSFVILLMGVLQDGLAKVRREQSRLAYLSLGPVPAHAGSQLPCLTGVPQQDDLAALMVSRLPRQRPRATVSAG